MVLSDLKTSGYCVVENLFSEEQLDKIRQDFELIKEFPVNPGYPVLPVGKCVPLTEIIASVIEPLCASIREASSIVTNFNPTPVYFSIKHGVDFDWHQDHESYFQSRDHADYLNIYVAINKPDPALSNVKVINFNKLFEMAPHLSFLKYYGATRFVCRDGKTILTDDNTDKEHILDFDINSIADCPNLKAGDALIMSGDCIHSTQDTLTDRVAMSIRRMNTETIVNRSNFDFTSKAKEFVFTNNIDSYNKLMIKFNNRDTIKLGELHDVHTR